MSTLSTQPLKEPSAFSNYDYSKWALNKKLSAKRKSYQENDLYGKTMILFELQLTEQLDQKLKQCLIETHKLTKRSKVLCPHVKESVQKFYKPGATYSTGC